MLYHNMMKYVWTTQHSSFSLLSNVLCFCLYLCISTPLIAQDSLAHWQGHWKGTMQLTYSNGKTSTVNNELIIKDITSSQDSLSRSQWTIIYGEGEQRQERAYELICLDQDKGQYLIDEKNSILLPAFFADQTLISFFEVMGNYIVSTYRREGDYLYFENISTNTKQTKVSGGQGDIPTVTSYLITNFQRAKLVKIK